MASTQALTKAVAQNISRSLAYYVIRKKGGMNEEVVVVCPTHCPASEC